MAGAASVRHRWVINVLDVKPDDHLLEIGCGHGIAISLVCEKLIDGSIVAIDRSAKVTAMASKRNAAHIASGKATILPVTLLDADFAGQRFDKVFASHVGFFWQKPERELRVIRELLQPEGAVYLLFQPLDPTKDRETTDKAISNLEAGGFSVLRTVSEAIEGGPIVCVVANVA